MRLARGGVKSVALRTAPAFLLAVVISGCHVPGTGASGTSQVTVAVVPGIDNAPLNVAAEDGIFAQHGLHVTIKDYTSAKDAAQAVSSGQAQVAGGDYTAFLGQSGLQFIADAYDAAPDTVAILALASSGITPQKLQGQDVATPPAAAILPVGSQSNAFNMQTLAAQAVLQNDGVSPSSVHWKAMDPAKEVGALQSGQVKAILVSEPYILQAEEKLGAVEVADVSNGVTSGIPLSGYFSKASFASANASAITAFQAALSQAQAECAQRGPAQAQLQRLTGWTAADAALITLGTYPTSVNAGQVQRVSTLMYNAGMIRNPVTVNAFTSS